jgi:two-component system, cell cycle sensor histidine kinase and response regulator CckA
MPLPTRLSAVRSSFQFKLFFIFTVLTAVITFLFGTIFVLHEIHENKRHASEKLQLLTKGFADSVRLPLYAENREVLIRYAQEALRLPQICRVEITSTTGKMLVELPAGPLPDAAHCLEKTAEVRSAPYAFMPQATLDSDPDALGSMVGQVRLYRGTDDLTSSARTLVITACTLSFFFWLLVSCSCYLLLRRVTRSFHALMLGLANVHGGDYVSRIEVLEEDEPGRACASVNELAKSLGERDAENRRLNAEVMAAMELEIASRKELVCANQNLQDEMIERSRARQELKNLVEQLPLGIIWSDADGTIEHLNQFMLERIGYGHDDVHTVEDWLICAFPDPEQRQRVAELRQTAINAWKDNNKVSFYDIQVVCKDGSLRDLNCSNQLSGTRTVDIMIDMTEREMLQRQIVRNQKLESIGILAGGIAHNFNNALTGVLGYISFARKFLDESHKVHQLLINAEKATNRAAGLANQLLTFANGGAPVKKVVSIAKLAERSLAFATSGSKVTGHMDLPATLNYVFVDDAQMYQAFNCICINAVQAMPEGGVLTVSGRNVCTDHDKIPVAAGGEYVELSFQDQGAGIREEDRANIFTPYFTTKAEVGTGLGLATVHSIVTRHGGVITFSSQVGKGTTFTLYLPAAKKAVPEQEPAAEDAAAGPAQTASGNVTPLPGPLHGDANEKNVFHGKG